MARFQIVIEGTHSEAQWFQLQDRITKFMGGLPRLGYRDATVDFRWDREGEAPSPEPVVEETPTEPPKKKGRRRKDAA